MPALKTLNRSTNLFVGGPYSSGMSVYTFNKSICVLMFQSCSAETEKYAQSKPPV